MSLTLRLGVMLSILSCPAFAAAEQHKLAASSVNSTYHSAGVALEAVTSIYLMPETGIKLTSVSTKGVQENIELLSRGHVDFAIVPSLMGFQARTGTEPFSDVGPQQDLRAVAMLVPTYFQAVLRSSAVRSGTVEDLFQLEDQRLKLGLDEAEAGGVAKFLFQQLGASDRFDELLSDSQNTVSAFRAGEIDALISTGNLPNMEIVELVETAGDDIRLLGVTDQQREQADEGFGLLEPAALPAETYPLQDEAVQILALPVFLATREDVDEEVVYQVAKIMFEQIGFLRTIHPAMKSLDFETAIDNLPVPLHPGAARYYRDFGLSIADATTDTPDYSAYVYRMDIDDPETRRIDTNSNVVGVMADPDATSLTTASDLAVVINGTASDLRVVAQRGEGSAQTINDLLYLKGVDLGIVQADVLQHLRDQEGGDWIPRQLHYLARLYDKEVHILARSDIGKVQELSGKTVNFGPLGSASEVSAAAIFAHLGLSVMPARDPLELALEKLKKGDIAALIVTGGKPISSLSAIEPSSGLKLLDVPQISHHAVYQEASIGSDDYPNLLDDGQKIGTLSVPAILMAYKWPKESDRYALLSSFYSALEEQMEELQVIGRFHPKWRTVSLARSFEGWPRSAIVGEGLSEKPSPVESDETPALPTPKALPLTALPESGDPAERPAPVN